MQPPPNIFQNVKYYVVGAIGDQVLQLLNNGGAKREMYLGEMVSHVIADSTDNEEYTEAQEIFDLPVVSSQWVLASVKCGKVLPPYAFRVAPRLFSGLVFTASMLGPDDAKALWATITYHGGQCHRVLSQAVTHLVATRPLGRKYGAAAGVQRSLSTVAVVTPDWIVDCVRQRRRLPTEDYHPSLLVEPERLASAVASRPDLESPKPGSGALVLAGGKGKVAECAEVPMPTQVYIPEETPIVKMTNMAAFPVPPPAKKSSPKAMLRNITNSGAESQPQPKAAPKSARQLIETIGREVSRGQVAATSRFAPASAGGGAVLSAASQPDQVYYGHDASETVPADMCLLGCIFYMADYQKLLDPEMLKVWTTVIEEHGGLVDPSYSNRVTHVLCEHQSSDVFKLALNDHKRVVTAYWLNDTLGKKRMDPPWYAYHFPSMHSEKICSNQIIAVSGFQNEERDRIKTMVQLLGAIYTGYMTRANSVLVCKRQEGVKYEKADEWGIPVVNVLWLSELLLGSLSALKLPVDPKYRAFGCKPDDFAVDLREYGYLMSGWRAPIKIPKESWKRFKPPLTPVKAGLGDTSANDKDPGRRGSPADDKPAAKRARLEGVRPKASTLLPAGYMPRILLTGINKVKANQYAQRVADLGGTVTTQPHECTHMVSDAVVRTIKFLAGINYCLCVVTSQWLEESFAAKEFLDEAAFALADEKYEDEFQCNIQRSLEKAKSGKKVFDGLSFHITPSVQPALKILADLIKAGGGHLLARRPTAKAVLNSKTAQGNPSTIVVTCYHDVHLCRDLRAHGIDVYNSEFVVTGLLQQTVDYRSFVCSG